MKIVIFLIVAVALALFWYFRCFLDFFDHYGMGGADCPQCGRLSTIRLQRTKPLFLYVRVECASCKLYGPAYFSSKKAKWAWSCLQKLLKDDWRRDYDIAAQSGPSQQP